MCGAVEKWFRRRGRYCAGGSAEGQYQCGDTESCTCILFVFVGFFLRAYCHCEESGRLTCVVQGVNGISNSGVSSLASSIKDNTTLTVLDLVRSLFSLALLLQMHSVALLFRGFY